MSSLELWRTDRSPFSLLRNWDGITKELDSFFNDFDKSVSEYRSGAKDMMLSPACDVQEDGKGFLLSFDLPGFKKEDVNIEVVGNQLTVSGKRERETTTKEAKFHRVERNHGEFRRVFTLPESVKGDAIEASYDNGVLYLMIPKAEIERPRKVEITEGKGGFLKKLVGVKGEEESKKAANS
ncbi:Hsp20/alpha crystallin family protein [Oligoflexus tunisiensis]|uniref:Hsp20/alpha crystallin family protein n=1 Tax=Oligoflexus tunisiensis TaxID=708132 RepID=UPI00114CCFC9|nr:Hsp20/alpha crystallin family protein [Oligoflexus tunisiensis]